jgi:tetratricopeptide (TPR) repeat protein
MKKAVYMGLSVVLSLAVAMPVFSQGQFKSTEESSAYYAFFNEQNPARKAELAEKFLTDYKDSELRSDALLTLGAAYQNAQNWAKVMEIAARFDQEFPMAEARRKATMYDRGMTAAQMTGNFQKIIEYGDKLLAVDPNNLNAQITLSSMIPEQLPQGQNEKNAALAKAMDLGTKAHNQVEAMFKGPKPEGFTDAQWNQQKTILEAQVHATLGMIHLVKGEYNDSVSMYEYVVELTPKDGVSQFRLGLGYSGQATESSKRLGEAVGAENAAKTRRADQIEIDDLVAVRQGVQEDAFQKTDKAIESLARAVAIGGEIVPQARQELERLYKIKNNDSLTGLDALISAKKAELGV